MRRNLPTHECWIKSLWAEGKVGSDALGQERACSFDEFKEGF